MAAINFADESSVELWPLIVGKKVNLVPLRTSTVLARARKASEIRNYYAVSGPLAFIHLSLLDNRSEVLSSLKLKREEDDFVIEVSGVIAKERVLRSKKEALIHYHKLSR